MNEEFLEVPRGGGNGDEEVDPENPQDNPEAAAAPGVQVDAPDEEEELERDALADAALPDAPPRAVSNLRLLIAQNPEIEDLAKHSHGIAPKSPVPLDSENIHTERRKANQSRIGRKYKKVRTQLQR
jgi:hypothetical protein